MTKLRSRLTLAAGLMLGTALPAFAQDLCGGVGVNGQWIGGDEASSDIATAPDYLEQMALVLMNNEYVALFSTSAGMDLRMEAQGRGAGDPVIDIRDALGNIVLSDDDSGGNSASRAEGYLEAGTYCLSMRSYDGAPMTGFVRVSRMEQMALTEGMGNFVPPIEDDFMPAIQCDPALTTDLGGGMSIDGDLATVGVIGSASVNEVPFWSFTLDSPQAVTITAENENADPYITIYDSFGSYLGENDDYNGLNSQIDFTYALSPGTYCIAMTALTDITLPVTVAVTAYDPQAALLGMYDRAEASPPMDGSYPITALGALGPRLRKDVQSTSTASWFSFDVSQDGLLVVEAITNGMGDPVLVLFDDFGRQIGYNDDANDTLDSMLTARVQRGTYLVAVYQLGEGPAVLTRLLFERFVQAQ